MSRLSWLRLWLVGVAIAADYCFLTRHELDFLMHGNVGAFGSSVAFILKALCDEPLA